MKRTLDLKMILDSPTYSTWLNLCSKYFLFLIITPLLLTKIPTDEIALWYLFGTITAFAGLFDLGFAQTLIRYSGFIKAGSQSVEDLVQSKLPSPSLQRFEVNWLFFKNVLFVYRRVYLFLALVILVVLSLFVTPLILKTLLQSGNIIEGFSAWGVTILGVCINLYGKQYDSVLRGMNFIPLINRWEISFNILQALLYLLVLVLRPRLLYLVIVLQLISVVIPLQKQRLITINIPALKMIDDVEIVFNEKIFRACWEPTWKTGVMMASTQGVNYLSGAILSNFISPSALASFLFSQKILQILNQFSWPPFYSKIPVYNELRKKGQISALKKSVLLNSNRVLYILIFLTFFAGILMDKALVLVHANTSFVTPTLWVLMTAGIFMDRIQAMHGQIYMTTNDIKFYRTSLISGFLYVAVLLSAVREYGTIAPPIAFLLSNTFVNAWYNMKHSLASLRIKFMEYLFAFLYKPLILFVVSSTSIIMVSYIW